MANIEQSIGIDVPVRTAYNQWTQFEEFPRFMEGVREVRQLDDRRLLHRLSDTRTRVMLQVDYDPEGAVENIGDAVGVVSARIRGDLQRFKEFIVGRGRETGGWRGEIEPGGRETRGDRVA